MKAISFFIIFCYLINISILCMDRRNVYDEALKQVAERRSQKQLVRLSQRSKVYDLNDDKDNEQMYMDMLKIWEDNRLKKANSAK